MFTLPYSTARWLDTTNAISEKLAPSVRKPNDRVSIPTKILRCLEDGTSFAGVLLHLMRLYGLGEHELASKLQAVRSGIVSSEKVKADNWAVVCNVLTEIFGVKLEKDVVRSIMRGDRSLIEELSGELKDLKLAARHQSVSDVSQLSPIPGSSAAAQVSLGQFGTLKTETVSPIKGFHDEVSFDGDRGGQYHLGPADLPPPSNAVDAPVVAPSGPMGLPRGNWSGGAVEVGGPTRPGGSYAAQRKAADALSSSIVDAQKKGAKSVPGSKQTSALDGKASPTSPLKGRKAEPSAAQKAGQAQKGSMKDPSRKAVSPKRQPAVGTSPTKAGQVKPGAGGIGSVPSKKGVGAVRTRLSPPTQRETFDPGYTVEGVYNPASLYSSNLPAYNSNQSGEFYNSFQSQSGLGQVGISSAEVQSPRSVPSPGSPEASPSPKPIKSNPLNRAPLTVKVTGKLWRAGKVTREFGIQVSGGKDQAPSASVKTDCVSVGIQTAPPEERKRSMSASSRSIKEKPAVMSLVLEIAESSQIPLDDSGSHILWALPQSGSHPSELISVLTPGTVQIFLDKIADKLPGIADLLSEGSRHECLSILDTLILDVAQHALDVHSATPLGTFSSPGLAYAATKMLFKFVRAVGLKDPSLFDYVSRWFSGASSGSRSPREVVYSLLAAFPEERKMHEYLGDTLFELVSASYASDLGTRIELLFSIVVPKTPKLSDSTAVKLLLEQWCTSPAFKSAFPSTVAAEQLLTRFSLLMESTCAKWAQEASKAVTEFDRDSPRDVRPCDPELFECLSLCQFCFSEIMLALARSRKLGAGDVDVIPVSPRTNESESGKSNKDSQPSKNSLHGRPYSGVPEAMESALGRYMACFYDSRFAEIPLDAIDTVLLVHSQFASQVCNSLSRISSMAIEAGYSACSTLVMRSLTLCLLNAISSGSDGFISATMPHLCEAFKAMNTLDQRLPGETILAAFFEQCLTVNVLDMVDVIAIPASFGLLVDILSLAVSGSDHQSCAEVVCMVLYLLSTGAVDLKSSNIVSDIGVSSKLLNLLAAAASSCFINASSVECEATGSAHPSTDDSSTPKLEWAGIQSLEKAVKKSIEVIMSGSLPSECVVSLVSGLGFLTKSELHCSYAVRTILYEAHQAYYENMGSKPSIVLKALECLVNDFTAAKSLELDILPDDLSDQTDVLNDSLMG